MDVNRKEKLLLSESIPGNAYLVLEIKDEMRLVNRLSSMGILCGSQVEICQNHKNSLCCFLYGILWLRSVVKKAKKL